MVANGCYLITLILFINLTFPPSLSHAWAWMPSLSPRILVYPRSAEEAAAQQSAPARLGHIGLHTHWAPRGHRCTERSPSVCLAQMIPWCHLQYHKSNWHLVVWICPLQFNLAALQRLSLTDCWWCWMCHTLSGTGQSSPATHSEATGSLFYHRFILSLAFWYQGLMWLSLPVRS